MFRFFLIISFAVIFVQAYHNDDLPDNTYRYHTDSPGNNVSTGIVTLAPETTEDHDVIHKLISKVSDHIAEHIHSSFKEGFDVVNGACQDVINNTSNSTVMSETIQKKVFSLIGSPVIKKGILKAISKLF